MWSATLGYLRASRDDKSGTREDAYRRGGKPLPMPEIEAGHYLLDALHDLGLVWPSGFGPVPLPWGEIDAYSRSMDEPLEPFERRALRDMSAAYCSWLKRGEDPLALPPG